MSPLVLLWVSQCQRTSGCEWRQRQFKQTRLFLSFSPLWYEWAFCTRLLGDRLCRALLQQMGWRERDPNKQPKYRRRKKKKRDKFRQMSFHLPISTFLSLRMSPVLAWAALLAFQTVSSVHTIKFLVPPLCPLPGNRMGTALALHQGFLLKYYLLLGKQEQGGGCSSVIITNN